MKGQGMSINVIIIAALALLVLVVLAVIFLGRSQVFVSEAGDCVNKGGSCFSGACPSDTTEFRAWSCAKTAEGASQRCCVPISK